jgi:hypothetical protein
LTGVYHQANASHIMRFSENRGVGRLHAKHASSVMAGHELNTSVLNSSPKTVHSAAVPIVVVFFATMNRFLQTRHVFVAIVALGLFTMAARAVIDPDVWWHLRTGQLILQTHSLFHTDPYSFTRFGQPWVNHEWLSQVLLFSLYRLAGFGGLIVVFAALIAATLLLVYRRSPGRPYIAAVMTLWGAVASASTWGVRPQMFSLLLGSIFLVLLEASERRSLLLWWTAPLMLLWVNLHAGYPIGLAFIALFLVGEALESAIGLEPWQTSLPRLKRLGRAFAVCLALVAVNPNGVRIYWYPFQTLRSAAMHRFIHEWFSPDFHDPAYLPLLFMLLALIAGLALSPRRPRLRNLLLLLATLPAALRSMRHIPILILVIVPILAELAQTCLQQWGATRLLRRPLTGLAPRTLVINFLVLLTFCTFTIFRVRQVVGGQAEAEAKSFPAGAVTFLQREHISGPIMNHYNWGGYLIWKLYPQYPVFMDGRADVYGDALMNQFGATYYLIDDWKKSLQIWDIRTVVLPPDAPLITALKSTPEWKQIYADSEAVILTRPLESTPTGNQVR